MSELNPTVKNWGNYILDFLEKSNYIITRNNNIEITSPNNPNNPFPILLTDSGLSVFSIIEVDDVSFEFVNFMNSKVNILKIYKDNTTIVFQLTIPMLIEADDSLLLLIFNFIQEINSCIDLLEDYSTNQTNS